MFRGKLDWQGDLDAMRRVIVADSSIWINAALDALGLENTDAHGWRFSPHGWMVMRARVGITRITLTLQ